MRSVGSRVFCFFSGLFTQDKFFISGWFALISSCLARNGLTPLLFNGKNFIGRNNWFQLGILGLYFLISFLIIYVVCLLFEKWFPDTTAKFHQVILKLRAITQRIPLNLLVLIFSVTFFIWLFIKNTWVGDDAFITIRVIDNFINGHGLVWNVGERVQAFTHPLWLFLLIPFYALIRDPYQVVYWISLVVSLGTIFLVLFNFARTARRKIITTLLFASSMAFIDYSSSGLENPLTHLLLIIMLIVVVRSNVSIKSLFLSSLLAAFAAVNRLDTILFFIPVICLQFFELRKTWLKALGVILCGFLPLVVWEIFSLIYFGFPFPNTFYAKLGATSLPAGWLRQQAGFYFLNSIQWDPITLATIFISLLFVLLERNHKRISVGLGMIFYLVYIISIGGDFMSGRFFSALFVLAVALLVSMDFSRFIRKLDYRYFMPLVVLIVFLGLIARYPPVLLKMTDTDKSVDAHGIADEKLFYFEYTSWYARQRYQSVYPWGTMGIKYRATNERFAEFDTVGFFGYYVGPDVYVFDHLALADPLCSRLPILTLGRIGHMPRVVPAGYIDTLIDHYNNHIENPDLRLYYDKLGILIHDDIFSPDRINEIVNFNLQKYDYLLENYLTSLE